MMRPEVRNIFRTGRPTNFKLGTPMEYEETYRRQAHDLQDQSSRSQGHVMPINQVLNVL